MSVVAFLGVPVRGHVGPTVAVVAELVRRGHAVTYHTSREFADELVAAGASVRLYPETVRVPSGRPTPVRMLDGIARTAVDLLPQVLAELRDIRPDLIVHDSACYWGAIAARELGVRAVSLHSTFAYNAYAPSPTRVSWRPAAEAAIRPRAAFRYLRARRTLRRRHDTRGLPRYDLLDVRQPLNLVFTSREFQPGAGVFDPSHQYTATGARPDDPPYRSDGTGVGPRDASYQFVWPCVGVRSRDSGFPIDRLQGPVLYVSLGSAPAARPRLLRAMVAALAPIGGTVVIATGGTDPAALGPLPGNVIARPFVPQDEVLLRAALFVTNGGLTSVNEALNAGVPMLVIPRGADQPLVAARVVQLGAGLSISPREADARVVHALARRLLGHPRFQAAADGLQVAQREAGGPARAADELEHYLRAGFHPAQADSPQER